MSRWLVFLAGALGALGVMVGAFAAHGLESMLVDQGLAADVVAKRLDQCEVAVRYHLLHVLALLVLGLSRLSGVAAGIRRVAATAFLTGLCLFSGGLYSMVFLGQAGHWAIVPLGGLAFILAWLLTASMSFSQLGGTANEAS